MRRLQVLDPTPGPGLYDALRAAVDGTGPAITTDPRVTGEVDDEVCLVVPTSGSTGEPKHVELTADCLEASRRATAEVIGEGRWWIALPLTHIAGLQVILRSLAAGHEPSLAPEGCTHTSLVPTQLLRLLDDPRLLTFDAVLLGGAAAAPSLLTDARARGVRVVTTYGMTETSGGCVYDGTPLPGVTVDVADRVVLSGPVVARGYRDGPRFQATFTTSDLGVLKEGVLTVLGRADDVIVTGGEKVAPLAVEQALASHPSVRDVAVVGLPDDQWGQRVVAFVTLGAPLSLDEARDHVTSRVSRVAAPQQVVVLDVLPLLPGGKVDRLALRSWAP